ncbi:hypothetical protein [Mycoplasmopsis cricetuli]|uniref:hypothetical protein n=1 Tax=Mycoplasmopsis cricetuli TaxID=171283 RepID=UPI0004725817|nr:hypothetical protein [Mycoplasmopsis cricetuli]
MKIPRIRRSNIKFQNDQNLSNIPKEELKIFKKIYEKINNLGFENSRYLTFSDIVENFAISGVGKIIEFVNALYKNNIGQLIVICNSQLALEIEGIIKYILGIGDLYLDHKINITFITENESNKVILEKIKHVFERQKEHKSKIIFTSNIENINHLKNIFKFICLVVSKLKYSSSISNDLFYYIGPPSDEYSFLYSKLKKQNLFFSSNTFHFNYSAFSSLSLILLATQGINIAKFVKGYTKALKTFKNNDIYKNDALRFAWYLFKHDFKIFFFVSVNKETHFLVRSFAYQLNKSKLVKQTWFETFSLPEDIPIITQPLTNSDLYIEKSIMIFNINYLNYDFQFTSDINQEDTLKDHDLNTLLSFTNAMQKNFLNLAVSINSQLKISYLKLENTKDETCGMIIAFIYWTKIFLASLQEKTPFPS